MLFKSLAECGRGDFCLKKTVSPQRNVLTNAFGRVVLVATLSLGIPLTSHAGNDQNQWLTLPSAIRATLDNNPSLSVFRFKEAALQGERRTQSLSPPLALNAGIENALGTDNYSAFSAADITLALSSVIEMGGQAEARVAVVDAREGQLAAEQRVKSLDLLGEVTRRYIDVIAAQERQALTRDAKRLADEITQSIAQRAQAGLSPEAEVLRAKAAQTQATIEVNAAESELIRARNALAAMWGEPQSDFERAEGNLFALGEPGDFNALVTRLERHPALAALTDESRLKNAVVRLAQSQRATDVEWNAGLRRLQETQDMALVAGISIPLGNDARARGAVKSALAERDGIDAERDVQWLLLRSQLADAFERRRQALSTVATLKGELLPTLENALRETRLAYERGRYSYVEWAAAKTELILARRQTIDAAADALRYRADIEQLTSEPLNYLERDAQ